MPKLTVLLLRFIDKKEGKLNKNNPIPIIFLFTNLENIVISKPEKVPTTRRIK